MQKCFHAFAANDSFLPQEARGSAIAAPRMGAHFQCLLHSRCCSTIRPLSAARVGLGAHGAAPRPNGRSCDLTLLVRRTAIRPLPTHSPLGLVAWLSP